jgi:hypothetical protein
MLRWPAAAWTATPSSPRRSLDGHDVDMARTGRDAPPPRPRRLRRRCDGADGLDVIEALDGSDGLDGFDLLDAFDDLDEFDGLNGFDEAQEEARRDVPLPTPPLVGSLSAQEHPGQRLNDDDGRTVLALRPRA